MAEALPRDPRQKQSAAKAGETVGGVSFVPKAGKTNEADTAATERPPSRDQVNQELAEAHINTASPERRRERSRRGLLRPLRTYRDDIAEVLRKTKGSKISIRAAEEKRRKERLREEEGQRRTEEKLARERASAEQEKRERETARMRERLRREREAKVAAEALKPSSPPATPSKQDAGSGTLPPQARKQPPAKERRDGRASEVQRLEEELRKKRLEVANRRPVTLERDEKQRAGWAMFGASVLLIGLGIGLLYAAYTIFFAEEPTPPEIDIDTLVFAEESRDIVLGDLSVESLAGILTQEKRALSLPPGNIANLRLLLPLGSNAERAVELSTAALLSELAEGAPESLARSMGEQYMLGIHVLEQNEVFLILKPTFYENAFAGMLAWEPDMVEDLNPLFTTLALDTTAELVSAEFTRASPSPFEDKVIENKDARVVYTARGEIALLYSFVNRDTLIITTNRDTLVEVFERMAAKRALR